jgi:diguanylate cyclase (GGDEF)-like protein
VRVQPLRGADGSIIGAIEIFSDDSAHTEALRKTEEMRRMAFLDHLTQLPNRRFAEMSLQTALNEYQLHRDPFGVLMIDLDRFKEINDTFGHSCGDRVLQEAAKTLVAALRPNDIVGRWGGDEFVAIIRSVNPEILHKLADRCVTILGLTAVPDGNGGNVRLEISVGANMVEPDDTLQDLIHRADKLMYQCKANGRGRATSG